ncbi:Uncharacterised protein [Moraxella lacunata]|uniref:Uncharacterized protein n=1 Tax=Moraxella lacunata TaxID=477 RepID=A0A378T5J6_MORLA|nr:Uncharacterised protein [Moraxella lacunata]
MKKLMLFALIGTVLCSNITVAQTFTKIHHLPEHIKSHDKLVQITTPSPI